MLHRLEADTGKAPQSPPRRFGEPSGADPRLTPQERHVLSLLVEGHHKKTAADVMGISVNTVSFHLKNIYAKLEVHSKTEAVVKALLDGLIVPSRRCPGTEGAPLV